jgi:hypothetical protein
LILSQRGSVLKRRLGALKVRHEVNGLGAVAARGQQLLEDTTSALRANLVRLFAL